MGKVTVLLDTLLFRHSAIYCTYEKIMVQENSLISCSLFHQSKIFILPQYYALYSVYILLISVGVKQSFSVYIL
jgi:hypothetical protein